MNYRLNIKCIGGPFLREPCTRVVCMGNSSSLLELHHMVQKAVSFDDDHIFDFYTANSGSPWADKRRFSLDEDWEQRVADFDRILLRNIWPLGRKKLYYLFDIGDYWLFEIRKLRSRKTDGSLVPRQIIERIGPDPMQYPVLEEN